MGSLSVWHWLIVLAVVLLLFGGRGKISPLMGDFGKGLSAFKKGVGAQRRGNPAGPGRPAGRRGQADLGAGHHDVVAAQPGRTRTTPPRSSAARRFAAA